MQKPESRIWLSHIIAMNRDFLHERAPAEGTFEKGRSGGSWTSAWEKCSVCTPLVNTATCPAKGTLGNLQLEEPRGSASADGAQGFSWLLWDWTRTMRCI
ncbi:hypothetical protein GN956_G6850 [Arapaima gigas]